MHMIPGHAQLLLRRREPLSSPHTASQRHQQRKQPCHWRALSARILHTCSWYVTGHSEVGTPWRLLVKDNKQFACLKSLFESVFCTPCTSAPVERIFSHGGLFIRPHRARMSDQLPCDLMLAKCNRQWLPLTVTVRDSDSEMCNTSEF